MMRQRRSGARCSTTADEKGQSYRSVYAVTRQICETLVSIAVWRRVCQVGEISQLAELAVISTPYGDKYAQFKCLGVAAFDGVCLAKWSGRHSAPRRRDWPLIFGPSPVGRSKELSGGLLWAMGRTPCDPDGRSEGSSDVDRTVYTNLGRKMLGWINMHRTFAPCRARSDRGCIACNSACR